MTHYPFSSKDDLKKSNNFWVVWCGVNRMIIHLYEAFIPTSVHSSICLSVLYIWSIARTRIRMRFKFRNPFYFHPGGYWNNPLVFFYYCFFKQSAIHSVGEHVNLGKEKQKSIILEEKGSKNILKLNEAEKQHPFSRNNSKIQRL